MQWPVFLGEVVVGDGSGGALGFGVYNFTLRSLVMMNRLAILIASTSLVHMYIYKRYGTALYRKIHQKMRRRCSSGVSSHIIDYTYLRYSYVHIEYVRKYDTVRIIMKQSR